MSHLNVVLMSCGKRFLKLNDIVNAHTTVSDVEAQCHGGVMRDPESEVYGPFLGGN